MKPNSIIQKQVSLKIYGASARAFLSLLLGLLCLAPLSLSAAGSNTDTPDKSAKASVCQPAVIGTASYYTYQSCRREGTSGVWTASGERFDENDFTCAMRSREWGKMFEVTNLVNGKSVIVRLNDFGPNKKLHKKGRIIDLSKAAFAQIADLKQGIIRIKIEELK